MLEDMLSARTTRKATALPSTGRFLYRSVAQALRERSASGRYRPGQRIATVEELADEFGVSSITVRRAVRDLTLEGVLIGRQGLGVFVANRQRIVRWLTSDRIAPIEKDIEAAGMRPGLQEISMSLISGDEEAPAGLVRSNALVYRLERILLADDQPVALDTLWLPKPLGDKLNPALRGHFVMSMLQARGISFDHIDFRFEAATASEHQAALLHVVTGFPLLVIRFSPILRTGRMLLAGRTVTRADRFTYEFCGRPKAHGTNTRQP
jgi:GntR family transcriptional regulator